MKSPTKMSTKENRKHLITSLEARKKRKKLLSPGFLTYTHWLGGYKHPQLKWRSVGPTSSSSPGFQLKIWFLSLVTSNLAKSFSPRVVRTTTRNLLGWCCCCSWWCRCCWWRCRCWRWRCRCWRCLWFSPSIREILKLSEIHVMIGFDTMNFEWINV